MEQKELVQKEIDSLKKQVSDEKAKLVALARQNTEYNAEIQRLKALKDKAENDASVAVSKADELAVKVAHLKDSLAGFNRDVANASDRLASIKSEIEAELKDKHNERVALSHAITGLTANKEGLQVEVAQLKQQAFNAGVNLNTQNFTLAETTTAVNKAKKELAGLKDAVQTTKDSISAIITELNERKNTLERTVDSLTAKACELEQKIDDKEKELLCVNETIAEKTRKINIELKDKEHELRLREIAVVEADKKNRLDSMTLNSLRQALDDERKNIKLFELKLRDFAKKKDIDIQIASLAG